jgi:hypothetical protein
MGMTGSAAYAISVCLKGQSGDIIQAMSNQQNSNSLALMAATINSLTAFNGNSLSSNISTAYNSLQTNLQAYSQSNTLDISDSAAINDLLYISSASNYNCVNGDFAKDSWIPSIIQTDNAIPCRITGGGPKADKTTCPTSAGFIAQTSGCTGCMDTYSLLYGFDSSQGIYNYLNSRYTDCPLFSKDLSNIWINYYLIKRNALQPVSARSAAASTNVKSV